MEQSVPKRRHIKFRRRVITQKKAYNIQNTAKAWNQEIHSFTLQSALRQVLSRSEFSTEWDLVHSIWKSSILLSLWGHPVAASVFFLIFSSLLSLLQQSRFRRQFLRKAWPIQLAFLRFIVCRSELQTKNPRILTQNSLSLPQLLTQISLRLLAPTQTGPHFGTSLGTL